MGAVKDEIQNAINLLNLSSKSIIALNDAAGRKVFDECLSHFVKSGDRKWWWEDFKQPIFSFPSLDKPFEFLTAIIPETENNVWFIAEDEEENFYPVYDASPNIIGSIIGECFAFEYYIVSKNMDWLLCENHHNSLIGIGEKLRTENII